MQLTAQLYSLKPFEVIEFEQRLHELKENVCGKSQFNQIIKKMQKKSNSKDNNGFFGNFMQNLKKMIMDSDDSEQSSEEK